MCNTIKEKGNIYNLARVAKERLKTNTYTKVKGNTINTGASFANYITTQKKTKNNKPQTEYSCTSYDDELYKKVCELLETNNTTNPISQLIDKQLFSSLDVEAKQFYINNLTQKYKFMKSRYYSEHAFKQFI